MENILYKIERFLSNQTIWIFLTAILFVSNVMTLQHEQTWSVYLTFVAKISFLFSPVLLFSIFRNRIQKRVSKAVYWAIRAVIFLLFPTMLLSYVLGTNWNDWMTKKEFSSVIIQMTGFAFLGIELLLILNNYWSGNTKISKWLKQLSLEKIIFILMVIFSIVYGVLVRLLSADAYFTDANFFELMGFGIQIFCILVLYYIFYLINHYLLITRLLKQKGLVYYIFGFTATLLFLYPIITQIIEYLPLVMAKPVHPVHSSNIFGAINWMIPFTGMLASIPFILAIRWFKQSSELATLAKEKSETELSLLKQQINPHFFFNTLNNLYALSITKDAQTPEVILQLSELMRYVIYRGKEAEVRLQEEVKYIEDYIQLQQIRLHKDLDFRFEKSVENENLAIPPLLFITFVENAFKHGIEPAEGACFLHLHLKNEGNHVVFSCENSIEEWTEKEAGIGLENLRRRMELLFPNQHELTMEKRKNSFFAKLEIFIT